MRIDIKPNVLLHYLLPLLAACIIIVVVGVGFIYRDSLRLRWAQSSLNRRRRTGQAGLDAGDKIVVFCADVDAADAEAQVATPLRREGVVVELEHGVDWNTDDEAVVEAIATAIANAQSVIFFLTVEYLSGKGDAGGDESATRLQNKTAR